MQMWEVVAREGIRDTLALYNWSGDAGRIEELTESFCPDGQLEVRGIAVVTGRAAIAEFLGGVTAPPAIAGVKRIVRHTLTNIRFTELTPERAQVSSYFTVFTEIGLDHYGRYRDVLTPVAGNWLIARRFVSTDWRAPNSTMAPPPSSVS
ncbi:nuclear transport factor 2 family protein [Mycobacterium sp. CVI_P3]|uniref:Nuclear transport factor 2 family protein n=1 Tax=Mycobacterium pinniadriaticum TaxID=2994102 RepID=A0ABT3SBI2_9MYCO|nr:nuclear transport factor 2 family protein [Mycobacterium pinniadriaticum]MCX2929847.1 nuclear transport factor 2 family protein [Mycobacterium pinniadriaticum]MCX2936504.1 nuclear transport factor 2 family protein [Mycobacterium pinniadriaticum]